MATVHRFVVVPAVPENLSGLTELAYNIWSLWKYDAVSLFNRLDPDLWEKTDHNPVALLNLICQEKLQAASLDEGFLAHYNRVVTDFRYYMQAPTWFSLNQPGSKAQIAYFSAEYGLHESLPIYSGGLGVLSGDHMKSASELGLPLVGVGLLYRDGYFHQRLNPDGWQQEFNPQNNFFSMPLKLCVDPDQQPVRTFVDLPDSRVNIQVWKIMVGRVTIYAMDTNLPDNRPEDREITARLYGGDREMRIRQEIILGIGGIRILAALGIKPSVCHMNEGHSAFLALERCRVLMEHGKMSFVEAREIVAASNAFTTHTPVPAGNDHFPREMIEHYFGGYCPILGISMDELLGLGRINPADPHEDFGMTTLALRMAWHCNGVSKLHGEVSRHMWQRIWPEVPSQEIPITHITNGVHTQSWIAEGSARLYQEYLGANWLERPADHSVWVRTDKIPDSELWRVHERRKERLVGFVRQRLGDQMKRAGATISEMSHIDELLNPRTLLIGFARRFATYKRATLLLRNMDRLLQLLRDAERPVNFLFAGKAHPRDDGGKHFIQDIYRFSQREDVRGRIVFLEDYNMDIARHMTQGVDVWMNTPRRPMEASGTSGMKAAVNGVLNLSILDGWWCEAYDGENGWAIGSGEDYGNDDYQDEVESRRLFDIIEKSVVPLYYERSLDGLPRGWIKRMKNSIRTICPVFNTNRMVQEYADKFYIPANEAFWQLGQGHGAGASALADWRRKMRENWGKIQVRDIQEHIDGVVKAGESIKIYATAALGDVPPDHVRVELYFGPIDASGNIRNASVQAMAMGAAVENGVYQYVGAIRAVDCGQQAYAVRILPENPNIKLRLEPELIRWG